MLAVTYVVLAATGVVAAVIEGFLVPQRLPHGVEGLAVVLTVAGNLVVGLIGGIGTRTVAGALVPLVAWFFMVGFLMSYGPGGDVILPGGLAVDPGIPRVTIAFLLLGVIAGCLAVVLTLRYTRRADEPTSLV